MQWEMGETWPVVSPPSSDAPVPWLGAGGWLGRGREKRRNSAGQLL